MAWNQAGGTLMAFPQLTAAQRLALLEPPAAAVRMVLDTDTANEIDDQFALVYALLSPERIALEAVYAAPFQNAHAAGPADGMEQSYDEIRRVLERLGRGDAGGVFRGATRWLGDAGGPVPSPAAADLVARARARRAGPLYIVAIGAITNVASALLMAPEILAQVVVVWLGGNPSYWHQATEFNVAQDLAAAHVIFDSGVPLVHIPCINVTEHLRTTQAELARFVAGSGAAGDYLYAIYSAYYADHFARSKELWDLGPIAWLVNPTWVPTALIHSPILTSAQTWSHDPRRHLMREALTVQRDAIFADLFRKLRGEQPGR
jgi:inosine-uridine nucleoside N-ribohydrolase